MASLVLMSYQLGFKNIILCGVDLNNSKYFFNSDYYSLHSEVLREDSEILHETSSNVRFNVSVIDN